MKAIDNVFSSVALSHICTSVSDLLLPRINGIKMIEINTSAQPNSFPHLGTVTTLMSAFCLAEEFKKRFNVNVIVVFDYLENAKKSIVDIDGKKYQYPLSYSEINSKQHDYIIFLNEFNRLMSFLSDKTGVDYKSRSYFDFQADPKFRMHLIKMLSAKNSFRDILSPNDNNIHVRFPCPTCGLIEKASDSLTILSIEEELNNVHLSMKCPLHGTHMLHYSIKNDAYIDTGTSVRDVLKVAALSTADESDKLTVMLDGSDWGGAWAWNISGFGAVKLDVPYERLPVRYFSPAILDGAGAKFSKSIFVSSDTYKYLPRELLDSSLLWEKYGDAIFCDLLDEVRLWVSNPSRFFRNYSIEYLVNRLGIVK